MKKNFLVAAIIGFVTLGTANASEVNQDLNQDLNFMTDHEMHDVTGARLKRGFSWGQAMLIVNRQAEQKNIRTGQWAYLGLFAQTLIYSKKTYDVPTFTKIIARVAKQSK